MMSTFSFFQNGGMCLPEIFDKYCTDCEMASCSYAGLKQSPLIGIFHCKFVPSLLCYHIIMYLLHFIAINIVAIYWVLFFMTAFMEMVIACTFATWYWTMSKSDLKFWIVSNSLWITLRYRNLIQE